MKYEYMPMDVAPLICPNPVAAPPSGGGGFSIWSYMTAAVVASTVAAVALWTLFFREVNTRKFL